MRNETIPLWPGAVPLAVGTEPQDKPALDLHLPESHRRSAVLIFPGGGYTMRAAHEGATIAQFFFSHGIVAAVCSYRVAPRYRHPAPITDARRAMRLMRHLAGVLDFDPTRIAVMGFSAGGHLAATLSTRYDDDRPGLEARDEVDETSARPDASILCYPVISLEQSFAHKGSAMNLLGEGATPGQLREHSADRNVTAQTPPAFLFHTADDRGVPPDNSVVYAQALWSHGIDAELHVFEKGRHGVGLASDDESLRGWPDLMLKWLAKRGW